MHVPALDADPYIGRTIGGRFAIQALLGSGELGVVYRGIDQRSGQAVAVKVIHPDIALNYGDILLQAAQTVSQRRHAKIATLLGATRASDGSIFIVSEFLEGETLRSLLDHGGPPPPLRTADLLFQLCSALVPIHRTGQPHANLKPENVFLVPRESGDDFIKIVDAGTPEFFGVHQGPRGPIIVGNPKYFSPEQAAGYPVGLATDQFTLGVIGYQLLSGSLPFYGATPDQLLAAITTSAPAPLGDLVAGQPVPQALKTIIDRCLEKDPQRRFPDLRALATALAAVIKSTLSAPPPPRPVFGAGRDLSTVVAGPDVLAALGALSPPGQESTVAQELPTDFASLMQAAAPPTSPGPAKPFGHDRPLTFTGSLEDFVESGMLDPPPAASPTLPPPAPFSVPDAGQPAPGLDIHAAMAMAAAEVGAPGPGAGPLEGPPPAGAVPPGMDLFSAISEELSGRTQLPGAPAAPLATVADFASLTPDVLTRAEDIQANVQAAEEKKRRSATTKQLGLFAVIAALGAAAVWFFVFNPEEPEPEAPRRAAASAPASLASLPAPIAVRLVSEPAGLDVREDGVLLGQTPLDLTLTQVAPRALSLTDAQGEPQPWVIDPKALPPAPEEGPIELSFQGSPPSEAPPADGAEAPPTVGQGELPAAPGSVAQEATPPAQPASAAKAEPKKAATSAAGSPRKRNTVARPPGKKGSKTDPNKIKDPFAD